LERRLVVFCPHLLEQQEKGREARSFARVLATVREFSPRVDAVRPGVCALPTRGPSRYFGGDEALAQLVAEAVGTLEAAEGSAEGAPEPGVGVADGLFAAVLAAMSALGSHPPSPVVVGPGCTPEFLAPWPVTVLERPELADLLQRLGCRTLGGFAALPPAQVLARFGTDGASCHAVAKGAEGELPALRLIPHGLPGTRHDGAPPARQMGFFGGGADNDLRARAAVARVQRLLHPEAVVRGRLQGGRGPSERVRLVPWGERNAGTSVAAPGTAGDIFTFLFTHPTGGSHFPGGPVPGFRSRPHPPGGLRSNSSGAHLPPWPGQVPAPSPVVVLEEPLRAELADARGDPVNVSGGGMASAAPARLSVGGGPWCEVSRWAGPWPCDERWWSRRRKRQARMQVITSKGAAYLLVCSAGWWVEGIYD
jgi:protein ImuB